MRKRFSFGFVLAILLIILLGCASPRPGPKLTRETSYGKKLPPELVAKVKEGTSTREEVRSLFGQPNTVSLTGDGKEMWMYTYSLTRIPVTQTVVLDHNTGPRVLNKRNPETIFQMTQILFTKDGVVEKMVNTTSGGEVRSDVVAE